MSKNWFDQSSLWTLKLTISQEWTDGINRFFTCWYKFMQIKRWLKIFGEGLVKSGCGQSREGTPKLTIWGMNRWNNWFFACWSRFTKIRSWSNIFWVGMVKKKVWQVWSWDYKIGSISEINQRNELIFVCRYRFRKAKSWFNCFLVVMVKNGHDQLLHETLKSVAS